MNKILFLFVFVSEIFAVIEPIKNLEYNKQKAELGKEIFFDTRFSKNGKISCNTCHDLKITINGSSATKVKNHRTLSVLNSANNYFFFSDASFTDIKDVVKKAFTDEYFLNLNEKTILQKIKTNPKYKNKFKEIYQEISFENLLDAMENFLMALNTLNSEFDRYLKGEIELNEQARKGYEIFLEKNCIACHNGSNLGSNVVVNKQNFLNFNENLEVIKVPNLRNITIMPSFFNINYSKNLKSGLKYMLHNDLRYEINAEEILLIYEFLKSLNGEKPEILR